MGRRIDNNPATQHELKVFSYSASFSVYNCDSFLKSVKKMVCLNGFVIHVIFNGNFVRSNAS